MTHLKSTMAQNYFDENRQFNLHYNQKIWLQLPLTTVTQFIRRGDEREPIPDELSYGAGFSVDTPNEYETLYRSDAAHAADKVPRVDFRIDGEGFIIPKRSTGLSVFSILKKMPKRLREPIAELWKLSAGTPFPEELHIVYRPRKKHGGIKPAKQSRIKPEQLKEMLKCLPWEKHHPAPEAETGQHQSTSQDDSSAMEIQ